MDDKDYSPFSVSCENMPCSDSSMDDKDSIADRYDTKAMLFRFLYGR